MLFLLLSLIVFLYLIYFFRNTIIQNIYKLPKIRKSWQLPDMDASSVQLKHNYKPVVVCCGDSITHGHIGYNWVGKLRENDTSKIYINAGINALKDYDDLLINFVGDITEIEKALKNNSVASKFSNRIVITHASDVINMDDSPSVALRH